MAPGLMIVKTNSNMSHWTLDDGYEEDPVKEEYPIRVTGSGQIAALDLGLILYERDFDYSCRGFDQGFLVTLTTPGETLKLSSNSLRVPILENTLIKIYPKLTTTSNGLLSYKPNRRQCFFAFERRLRFFKMYTQNNCEAECLSNFTKNECKCVKFSMPSKNSLESINSKFHQGTKNLLLFQFSRGRAYKNLWTRANRML